MARLNSIVRERLRILSEPNVKPLATATLFNAAGNNVSSSRLSAGLSAAGSRWSEMLSGSWGMARSLGGDTLVSGGSVGSRTPGFMWARASLRDRTAGVALRRYPCPRAPLAVSDPAISLATATAGRHRCPQSASRPPANPPSTRIRARIIAPVTPLPPSTVLASSIGGFGLRPRCVRCRNV